MKHSLSIGFSISLMLILVTYTFTIPKTMAIDLQGGQNGVYTSEVFKVPLHISDAKLDISVLVDTYLRVSCEIRAGEDYVRFHLSNMSMSYHFEYDILEFFGSLSSLDVSLTVAIDTDGVIQGIPRVYITYYGFW